MLALALPPAAAEETRRPPPTPAMYIAMLYEKFAHAKRPDFAEWVKKSKEYREAELHEQPEILEREGAKLKSVYDLMYMDNITVTMTARLSGYSPMGGGFLVQNFNEMMFFNYVYLDRRYAVVPEGITRFQWLKAPPEDAAGIMRETANGQSAKLVLTLAPVAADPKPMVMQGRKYHLLMAEVSKIEMLSKDGTRTIWDDTMNAPRSLRNKLREMYRR